MMQPLSLMRWAWHPSTTQRCNSFVSNKTTAVPVRQVSQKKLPAARYTSRTFVPIDLIPSRVLFDAVTGEPLHGVRHYSVTGELYEGKFRKNGIRHGPGAIVKNIALPPCREAIPELLGELAGADSTLES
jgi:hypothetical protein